LVACRRGSTGEVERAQDLERGDVGVGFGFGTAGCEIVLAGGPERG